ncbi:MAG TPA: GDSL-type esterase/lipase family protein [Sedimentisphaerales bacterium]|jgi:lysophospholipase L1-like esterase|nr:GDSL-type esterase/lipase family protein [Sedimentisphaerales bacterium]HNU31460.1 GDSL-type esterase/lipase family protein [Sedimentisphaerales bacterium]
MKARAVILAVSVAWGWGATVQAKLVACVGDSITYGAGIVTYPKQLQGILRQYDAAWEVRNFGVSGATLLRRGDKPYIAQAAYTDARTCNPDVVVIKLGTNDSKPQNWQYKDDFVTDYSNMIDVFRSLPSKPAVWICKPVPAFAVNFTIRPDVIRDEILPLIDRISQEKGVPVIDLYAALLPHAALFPDSIHPNTEGAGIIAETVAPFLLGVTSLPDYDHDGVLNLRDFALLARRWLDAEPSLDVAPPPAGDGVVGYSDLGGLAAYWMKYPRMVARWKLDESEGDLASDALGQFGGTVYGSPLWRPADGRLGGAIELDGVDDCIRTGAVLNPADGPFTVFAWVQGGQPGQAILSQSNQPGPGEVWLGTEASTGAVLTNLIDVSRGAAPLVSQTCITDGAWHLLRFVWDGSYRRLYVDGREVAADTARKLGALKLSSGGFNIGAGKNLEPGSFWSGLIDDIRIYDRAVLP